MIIQKEIEVCIVGRNKNYYANLGFDDIKPGNQFGSGSIVSVPVNYLPNNSQKKVECQCDKCGKNWKQQYQIAKRNINYHLCYSCSRKHIGKTMNRENIDKATRCRTGENHPRWNSNKSDFLKYSRRVRWLSEIEYKKYETWINPEGRVRTLCGGNGYQLDHKLSIKKAYEMNLNPEYVAQFHNLQLLSWQRNRAKSHK